MADDITLTVRVRDLSRGDFDRLHGRLDRMKHDLQGVNRSTDSAGMHSKRLGQDIEGLSNKFKRMQETGNLTRRELTQMKNSLDGMSRSALNAARSGEITSDRYRSLTGELTHMRSELDRLDRGLNNNTNAVRRNGNQHRTTVRMVNGVVNSVRTMTRSVDGNTNVINTWRRDADRARGTMNNLGNNGTIVGKTFGNMRAKLIGTAVVLGASLLPTIGALGPMLAGLGTMAGVAALAFSGLSKPTKMLSKDQREFIKGLRPLTNEYKNWQKVAREAILPKVTKSFGDIKKSMQGLDPVIKVAGNALGDLVTKIAKGVSNKDFMGPFLKNTQMGTKWVLQFAGSIGTFTRSLFDFGTKSQKALDAWQNLLGGFLDTGLPGMFKNMEGGISGASDWLDGLAYIINDSLLPSLGKILGSLMKTFGPFLLQLMTAAGDAINHFATDFQVVMAGLEPIMSVVTDVFRAFNAAAKIGSQVFGDLANVLGGALMGTLSDLGVINNPFGDLTNSFTLFSDWVKNNSVAIRSAFTFIAQSIIAMVQAGVAALPLLMDGFVLLTHVVLGTVGTIIDGLATAFGNIPGIGKIFKAAAQGFDDMKSRWEGNIDGMAAKVREFSGVANSNLSRAHLVLDVTEARRNLDDIRAKLKDPKLTATQRAKLEVDEANAHAALTRASQALSAFDHKKATARIEANNAPFFGSKRQADAARMANHSAMIKANTSGFWAGVRSLSGRVLGTSYINVQMRKVESQNAPRFSANGNIFRHFAQGGMEDHTAQIASGGTTRVWNEPETGGESYIPLSPAKRTRSRQIAAQTVGILGGSVQWFKKGGLTKAQKAAKARRDAEHQARSGVIGELTVSHFGKMAGSKNSENITGLTKNDTMQPLVDQLNHLRGVIKSTTHGITESKLLKKLDSAGRTLITNQKKLEAVNKSLDSAKTKLSDLKQAAAQLKDSVKSTVMGETDITKSAQADDSHVTVNTILSQMNANATQAKEFDSLLKGLQAKGLSKDLIAQIAQAGISGGGLETARALNGASKGQIGSLNTMEGTIIKSAGSAGQTASDAMYAAGIKAADGLVKGLEAKQKAIEKVMLAIAKSMEKSIKKALGIKSPSRVMMAVGHQTAEGFAVGMKRNSNVPSAWQSMLNVPSNAAPSAAAGYGGAPIHAHIHMGGREIGEVVIDPLRKAIRHRGGDVQAVLGK
jgi:hypothetical protein